MAVEIGALRALLSLDSAAFEAGAKRAQSAMSRVTKSLGQAARSLNKIGKRMTASITLPVVASAGAMVRSSLMIVDSQAKMAQSLDTSVASLQVLSRAADMAGISQGELEGALTRMTRRISLAEGGTGPAVKAFERLGLAASDFASLNADERIKLIQQRLVEFIPEAERAGVLSQIFGDRVGVAITRLDSDVISAAAHDISRFGIAVSDVDADKIEEANDAISAIGLAIRGVANRLTVALAPTLLTIAEKIQHVAERFAAMSPEMQRFTGIAVAVAAAIGPIGIGLGVLVTGLGALLSPIGLVVAALAGLTAGAVAVWQNWDILTEKLPILGSIANTISSIALPAFEAFAALLSGDFTSAWASAKEAISVAVTAMLSAIQDIVPAMLQVMRDLGQAIVDGIKAAAQMAVDAARQLGQDLINGIKAGIQERVDAVKGAISDAAGSVVSIFEFRTETRSPSRVFMRLGEFLMDGLRIGIVAGAPAAAAAAGDAAASVTAATDTAFGGINFADGLMSAFDQIITGSASMSEAFGNAMRQMALDFVRADLEKSIARLSEVIGGGSEGGGVLSSILSAVFGGFRASGGSVTAGKSYRVNERMPEAFIPNQSGKVVPLASVSGGGAPNVIVHNHAGAEVRTEMTTAGLEVTLVRAMKSAFQSGQMNRTLEQTHGLRPRSR